MDVAARAERYDKFLPAFLDSTVFWVPWVNHNDQLQVLCVCCVCVMFQEVSLRDIQKERSAMELTRSTDVSDRQAASEA
eukprot:5174134-Amphidinium_carterae.1